MEFQLHSYPASRTLLDIVIIANYTPDEVAALDHSNAWKKACVGVWQVILDTRYWSGKTINIRGLSYQDLVHPGYLIQNFTNECGGGFLNSFGGGAALAIEQGFIPIAAAYRRAIHQQQEIERDAWFNQQLQIGQRPSTQIFYHDQKYLPSR